MLAKKINKNKTNKNFIAKSVTEFNPILLNKFIELYVIDWG